MATLTRYSNIELLNLPDCRDLRENGKCALLNVPACTGEGCPYYRERNSVDCSWQRLCSLNEKTQEHIAQKYYGGARPWAQEERLRKGDVSHVSGG